MPRSRQLTPLLTRQRPGTNCWQLLEGDRQHLSPWGRGSLCLDVRECHLRDQTWMSGGQALESWWDADLSTALTSQDRNIQSLVVIFLVASPARLPPAGRPGVSRRLLVIFSIVCVLRFGVPEHALCALQTLRTPGSISAGGREGRSQLFPVHQAKQPRPRTSRLASRRIDAISDPQAQGERPNDPGAL